MENAAYLFAAFGIAWAIVFTYVLLLLGRQRRTEREMALLKERCNESA